MKNKNETFEIVSDNVYGALLVDWGKRAQFIELQVNSGREWKGLFDYNNNKIILPASIAGSFLTAVYNQPEDVSEKMPFSEEAAV